VVSIVPPAAVPWRESYRDDEPFIGRDPTAPRSGPPFRVIRGALEGPALTSFQVVLFNISEIDNSSHDHDMGGPG
jgi:hypothetical protein